jgi:hypothetical protein
LPAASEKTWVYSPGFPPPLKLSLSWNSFTTNSE